MITYLIIRTMHDKADKINNDPAEDPNDDQNIGC